MGSIVRYSGRMASRERTTQSYATIEFVTAADRVAAASRRRGRTTQTSAVCVQDEPGHLVLRIFHQPKDRDVPR